MLYLLSFILGAVVSVLILYVVARIQLKKNKKDIAEEKK